jgi:capsular exopolysaccharide synthesis family protein
LIRIFDRRRHIVVGTTIFFFLLAVCVCVVSTRTYQATGVIQLEKSTADSLNLDSLMGAAGGGAGDSMSANIDLQTKADILKSDTLALKVINELDLEKNKDFKGSFSPIGWVLGLVAVKGPPDPVGRPLSETPGRRARALGVFSSQLKVKVNPGTRLITVQYTNRDPKVAAAVVNSLVQALIDFGFQTKYAATNQVSEWLEGQLGDLRKQSEDLESRVVGMQKQTGLFGVGGTDLQGKPVVFSPALDRLQASTTQLTQAQLNRLLKASVYQVAKTGSPELISQLAGTSMSGSGSQGVVNSLSLIETLRAQEASTQAQVAQDSAVYGSAYPKLVQEKASLKRIQQSLQEEIARMAARAKTDYEVADKTEAGARKAYDADRAAADALNDRTIEYTLVAKEADQSQALYQDLLRKLKEAGILEGLRSSNLTIVDPGSPPSRPSSPNIRLDLMLGLCLGLLFGAGGAILVDAIDNKVLGVEEIEAMGMPLIGLVTQESGQLYHGSVMLSKGYSSFSEGIRVIRSAILMSRSGEPPKVMLVTSASQGEGKSTLAINIAASLAQFEKKVLLLEMDLRRPVLRNRLNLRKAGGMSLLLANTEPETDIEGVPDVPNLYCIPAGPKPPYPTELLGTARMQSLLNQWRSEFDYIVMDCPPCLPVSDVQVLEPLADATILIARSGLTPRVGLKRAYALLLPFVKDPERPNMGVVLNGVSVHSASYYGYYGYYGNKKYGYAEDKDKNETN